MDDRQLTDLIRRAYQLDRPVAPDNFEQSQQRALKMRSGTPTRWRTSPGDRRQRLSWLFVVGIVTITAGTLGVVWSAWGVWLAAAGILPVAIGVAILRSRYGTVPILNRSLVNAALTVAVSALYVVVVTLPGFVLQGSELLVPLLPLVATGVVAVALQPLRDQLQRGVNRLLSGERVDPYVDPYKVLAQLGKRLTDAQKPEAELPEMVATIAEALKLPYVAIELLRHGALERAASIGTPQATQVRIPMVFKGETVGQLMVAPRDPRETLTSADVRLLTDIARHAGMAVHAMRLTSDLQRSRERLVRAREEERRRHCRDLHDGLAQTLSRIALETSLVKNLLKQDPKRAVRVADRLERSASTATAEVRRLLFALSPPLLDELGLVSALHQHAADLMPTDSADGPTVTVQAPEALPELPAAVEMAAYRIAVEAMTNTVRHANARRCQVRLTLGEALEVEVRDDGRGLPDSDRAGIGLPSMRERAAELGGQCVIRTLPEGGTSVRAELPLIAGSSSEVLSRPRQGRPAQSPGDAASRAGELLSLPSTREPGMRRLRVIVADDHPLVRAGLRSALLGRPEAEVVGEAATGAEVVELAGHLQPDVVLMDLHMPNLNGIEATRQIMRASPQAAVLVMTVYDDDDSVFAVMRAGARGYLLKGADQDEIIRAVTAVACGEAIFGPTIAHKVLGYLAASSHGGGNG